jgi:hemoglobin
MTTRVLVPVLALVPLVSVRAQPAPERGPDDRVRAAVTAVIAAGAPTFNKGDPAGCCRIYEGGLLALAPMLDHRPDLQRAAKVGLEEALRVPDVSKRAFALREVLDKVHAGSLSPLWNRLGGEPAVRAVVRDFVARAAENPKVNLTRGGRFPLDAKAVERVEQLLVEQISAATGGPLKYTGRDMRTTHAGMAITDAEFDAGAADLAATLKKLSVPARESNELLAIIGSTRKDIVMVPEAAPARSLYERLGGEAGITAVVDDFVARAAANPAVNFARKGTANAWDPTPANVARLKQGLVDYFAQAAGGPLKYTGPNMKAVHKGMMITDAEFDALAGDLQASLGKLKVGAAERAELMKAVAATRGDIVEKK